MTIPRDEAELVSVDVDKLVEIIRERLSVKGDVSQYDNSIWIIGRIEIAGVKVPVILTILTVNNAESILLKLAGFLSLKLRGLSSIVVAPTHGIKRMIRVFPRSIVFVDIGGVLFGSYDIEEYIRSHVRYFETASKISSLLGLCLESLDENTIREILVNKLHEEDKIYRCIFRPKGSNELEKGKSFEKGVALLLKSVPFLRFFKLGGRKLPEGILLGFESGFERRNSFKVFPVSTYDTKFSLGPKSLNESEKMQLKEYACKSRTLKSYLNAYFGRLILIVPCFFG